MHIFVKANFCLIHAIMLLHLLLKCPIPKIGCTAPDIVTPLHNLRNHVLRHWASIFNRAVLSSDDHLSCSPAMPTALEILGGLSSLADQDRILADETFLGAALNGEALQDAVVRHQDFAGALEQNTAAVVVNAAR